MKKFLIFLVVFLCIILIIFGVFVYFRTDGFNSYYSNVYIEKDGVVVENGSSVAIPLGETVDFSVIGLSSGFEDYTVKVVPGDESFSYTYDGNYYELSSIEDLTIGFDISKNGNVFSITGKSPFDVLSIVCGENLSITSNVDDWSKNFFDVCVNVEGNTVCRFSIYCYAQPEEVKLKSIIIRECFDGSKNIIES